MGKGPTLVLAAVLTLTTAACETVNPDEYLKFTVAYSNFQGHGAIGARLKTRPGVTQFVNGWIPPNAKAVILWFPGGEGTTGNMGMDSHFHRHGIGFVNVGIPSDMPHGFVCCTSPFRQSMHHLRDVGAVIGYLKKETRLPIWLMGLSMGTVSIANVATNLPDAIDGVAFLSSITSFSEHGRRPYGETLVTEMSLSRIKVPMIAFAHALDTCATTPHTGALAIVRRATNAPVKEAKIFAGEPGAVGYGGCLGGYHLFVGLTDELVDHAAKFILANTKTSPRS